MREGGPTSSLYLLDSELEPDRPSHVTVTIHRDSELGDRSQLSDRDARAAASDHACLKQKFKPEAVQPERQPQQGQLCRPGRRHSRASCVVLVDASRVHG